MELVKKIDIHVHTIHARGIPRENNNGFFARPEELFAIYDRIGVDKAVLLPTISPDKATQSNTNEEIMEIVNAYPDRFAWFCNIDPRQGCNSADTDFIYFINYYKARGAKGVGELICNLYFDDPRCLALYKACETCNMPVLFHIGDETGDYGLIDELHLPRIERVLKMFPKLRLIGHSQRWWAEIGDDVTNDTRCIYPKGKVNPGRVVELMRKYPNMCGDLSAGSGFNAVSRDPEFGYAFLEEFQDRLYYGTDISDSQDGNRPMLQLAAFLDDAVTNGKISYDAYYKISRGNALKLLER